MKKIDLTIAIPIFNEEKLLKKSIARILETDFGKNNIEIIAVNDGSTDNSLEILENNFSDKLKVINLKKNHGKGFALKKALETTNGDFFVPFDADLEYDPKDIFKLLEFAKVKNAKAVFGSRNLNKENKKHSGLIFYFGGIFLSFLANLLYRTKITDEATCLKLVETNLLKSFFLKSKGFEFCPELVAKLAKDKVKIHELPIKYNPRNKKDGKKITIKDGLRAIYELLYWRAIPKEKYKIFEAETMKGKGVGRELGFPTINLKPNPEIKDIKEGVYSAYTFLNDKKLLGGLFVGNRKTFNEAEKCFEIHIIDEKITKNYKSIEFKILKKIRNVIKFSSRNKLKVQIAKDIEHIKNDFIP